MAKSKSCKIAAEQCDIAEAVYISNYRRNGEHHMAQVIPHPKFDFVPHRKAKNKKLVEQADRALEIEVLKASKTQFDFNVNRCRYAEMYREMGLEEIGHLLSCNRDATFCEGFEPNLKLVREQTLMEGASFCSFRYSLENSDNFDNEKMNES